MSCQQSIKEGFSPSDPSEEGPSSISINMAGDLAVVQLPVPPTQSTKKNKKTKKSNSKSTQTNKQEKSLMFGTKHKERSQQDGPKTAIPFTIIDNHNRLVGVNDDYSTESDDEQAEALTSQEIQDQRTKLTASESATEGEISKSTSLRSTTASTELTTVAVPKTSLQPASAAAQNQPGAFSVLSGGGRGGRNMTVPVSTTSIEASPTNTEPLTADVEVGSPSAGLTVEAVAVDENSENQRIREIEQRYEERLARLERGEDPDSAETTYDRRRSSSLYLEFRCSKQQTRTIKVALLVVGVVALVAIVVGLLVSGDNRKDNGASSVSVTSPATSPPTLLPGGENFGAPGAECSYVEMQTNLPNQYQYKNVFADIILDVSTNSPYGDDVADIGKTELVFNDVQNTFQSVLIPIIAGCRRIEEYQPQEPPDGVIKDGYLEFFHANRFMLANGFAGTPTIDGDCNPDEPKPCLRINVSVDLYVKGESTFSDFNDLMFNYFGPPLIDLMVTSSTGTFTKQAKLHAIRDLSP